MRYRTRHTTSYHYGDGVSVSQHIVHLLPREHLRQTCSSISLTIKPEPAVRNAWTDYFGNPSEYFAVQAPHRSLVIESVIELEVKPPTGLDAAASPTWEKVRDTARAPRGLEAIEANEFLFDSVMVKASADLAAYAAPSFPADRPVAEAALDLMHRIYEDFTFDSTATSVATPLAEVLAHKRGVCQDFAHLGVGCLRSLGLPGRYVSGYLRTYPPPGRERLIGADASHAWFSVWCGAEVGWVDLDPTNDKPADTDYITLAWGRDYDDVSPVRGVILGGWGHSLDVEVDVEPLSD
ncbi:transglutaminase [Skermanella stibiiresistens SB22]|uniref:Transglutaminase n=2 Tax=Skermanella TaxID=204447 RepID=W9H239_9PROT|nr:transglutaminase [Skermanella stibiiresistens SB22]